MPIASWQPDAEASLCSAAPDAGRAAAAASAARRASWDSCGSPVDHNGFTSALRVIEMKRAHGDCGTPLRGQQSFHYRRDWPIPEFRDVQYTERAIDYSAMWGDQLCWDTTTYVSTSAHDARALLILRGPRDGGRDPQLDDWGSSGTSPVEPAGSCWTIRRANSPRHPRAVRAAEFHARRRLDICGWCGVTLTSSDDVPCCAFCGRRTPMLFSLCRRSWAAAIPRSVEAGLTLEGRWRFEQDPAITRRSEHLAWLGLPMESLNASDPMTGRQARSICLNATRKT